MTSPEAEGELLLAGELLARYTDAALTAAKFVWREGTRWYRTGDIVRIASQRATATAGFEYVCRRDLQVYNTIKAGNGKWASHFSYL